MPPPVPPELTETGLPCRLISLKIGVDPDTFEDVAGQTYDFFLLDGTIDDEAGVDEMTGNKSNGFYDDVPTTTKITVNFQFKYEPGATPKLKRGAKYAAVASGTGAPFLGGQLRIAKLSDNRFKPKEGMKVTVTSYFVGAVTEEAPT
jgi:hypothetical protein